MSYELNCRGLTLIELMITLVILAVTVAVAAPAMQQIIHGSRLRTETSRLLDAVNMARSEAVYRNTPVSLCPSDMAVSGLAACAGYYAGGWIIFTNSNGDGSVDAGVDEVVGAYAAIPPGYRLTDLRGIKGVDALITYLPDGSSHRNLTLQLCPPGSHRLEPWKVVLNNVGRARAEKGEGACSVETT